MHNHKVCSVIITHNPTMASLASLVTLICNQVDLILIVDNFSTHNLQLHESNKTIEIVRLSQNLGIAAAQNIGVTHAISRGFTHILLLDQDSLPSPDLVSRLLYIYDTLHDKGCLISAVGPLFRDASTGNRAPFMQLGFCTLKRLRADKTTGYIPADVLISSGSLISTKVFTEVGMMDESLFIDLVDTEWFLRARAKGYQAFGVPDAIMDHSLGDKTCKVWFGRWRHVPQHKPFRNYYMFRNSLLLFSRGYIPTVWKFNHLLRLIYLFGFTLVLMPRRWKRLQLIVRGIRDGLHGKSGKLECDVA